MRAISLAPKVAYLSTGVNAPTGSRKGSRKPAETATDVGSADNADVNGDFLKPGKIGNYKFITAVSF